MKTVKLFFMITLLICTALVVLDHATVYANDMLYPGEELKKGDYLTSANRRYMLVFQTDGNLVLYGRRHRPLWSSNTQGRPVEKCIMQTDGNLVLYLTGNNPIWHSKTYRYPGSFLWLQNDGNLVIYHPVPVWSTGTAQRQKEDYHDRWDQDRERDRWRH